MTGWCRTSFLMFPFCYGWEMQVNKYMIWGHIHKLPMYHNNSRILYTSLTLTTFMYTQSGKQTRCWSGIYFGKSCLDLWCFYDPLVTLELALQYLQYIKTCGIKVIQMWACAFLPKTGHMTPGSIRPRMQHQLNSKEAPSAVIQ